MSKLTKTAEGRLLIHLIVVCNNIVHLRNPHLDFFSAAVVRYARGIG